MDKSEDILFKARQMLNDEIIQLQHDLRTLKKRLAQLDKILGAPTQTPRRQTISEALIGILAAANPHPLSTQEVVQQFQALGIHQRAKNPYNSIQALLHHLKKSTPPKVIQDPVTGKWSHYG
ncbi:MAG: hypothetical protein GX998_00170 [Firmicutes bacterium]|nr:hypothetical protein [Bacillota bacterium]